MIREVLLNISVLILRCFYKEIKDLKMIKKEIQTMINQIKSFFSDATIEKKLAIVDANSKKGEVLNEIKL